MTGKRAVKGARSLTTIVWWVIGLILALIASAVIWLFTTMHATTERGRQDAQEQAAHIISATREELRAAIADGDLSDEDIAAVQGQGNITTRVSREVDKVAITTRVEGTGVDLLGRQSVLVCSVYEVPLPITSAAVVDQHTVDSCGSTS
jgi:hypothetical protein